MLSIFQGVLFENRLEKSKIYIYITDFCHSQEGITALKQHQLKERDVHTFHKLQCFDVGALTCCTHRTSWVCASPSDVQLHHRASAKSQEGGASQAAAAATERRGQTYPEQ